MALNIKKVYNKLPLGSSLVKVNKIVYLIGKLGLTKDEEKFLTELGFELQKNIKLISGKPTLNDGNMIKVVVSDDKSGILQEIAVFDSSDANVEIVVNNIKEQLELTDALDIYNALSLIKEKNIYITRVTKQVVDVTTGVTNTYQNYYFSRQVTNIEVEKQENKGDDELPY